ncbi:MAG: 50S ribosomal protein L25 [Acidimicrobiales bacterium]|nr:50S ribosomal protein L25 [Acidimicrobiales bacterium]
MAELLLTAQTGRPLGTRSSRRLRREGHVPGVVYGLGQDPVAVTVPWPELRRVLTTEAGLNALITIDVDGDKQLSIVKEMQRHAVKRDVTHIDFLRVDPNEEIQIDVPIVLEGEAKEVENEDGMVDQTLFTLAVYAKPNAIPSELTVDISELTIGEAIRVSDIVMPEGSRTEVDEEEAVAIGTVTRSTLEAMAAEDAAEAAALEGEEGEGEGGEEGDGGGDSDDDGGDDAGGDE